MKASANSAIRIGAWRVDPALDEISKHGSTVKLERRAMQLLLCLAKHADEVVSVEQLLDEVWAGVVVTPDSVYHAVAALRRLLGDDTKQPVYIANVPRRGYRLIAPVAPWVDVPRLPLENPPAPAVEPASTILAVTKTGSPWRPFAIALSIALTLALGYVLVDRFWLSKHATTAEHQATDASTVVADRSIAVLPFVDMSEKHDQEYFADGMAEEVIDLLVNIPGLKVISRTSSFQFKGKNEDLRAIGTALGVSYVVEGSVRKSAERLRVTAQLINAQDGSHLWSDAYDESVGDTLKVQDQIASNLARALQVTVADYQLERPAFKSPEAYDLYLRGEHAAGRFDKEGLESAVAYFQQVLELDPTSVPALEDLSWVQANSADFGYVEPHEGFEAARRSAQRALGLDPKSTSAYQSLSFVHLVYDWDWASAERDAKEALRLRPRDPGAIGMLSLVYAALGRWDEATRLVKTALTLDPLAAGWHLQLGNVQIATGRPSDGEAAYRNTLQISPTFGEGHFDVGEALLLEGNFQDALAEMQQEPADGARNVGLAMAYHALGRRAESDAALARAVQQDAQDEASEIADAYAYRGELNQAFTWLERAYRQKDTVLYLIKGDPFFKNLKGDPRYKAFLRRMNLPE
jgi:TolB-like protein/DNA-binding winged helix-turn-helix (wHTH) protein/Flp pilus assembly protein TadD